MDDDDEFFKMFGYTMFSEDYTDEVGEAPHIDGFILFSRVLPLAQEYVKKCEIEEYYGYEYVSNRTLQKAQKRYESDLRSALLRDT